MRRMKAYRLAIGMFNVCFLYVYFSSTQAAEVDRWVGEDFNSRPCAGSTAAFGPFDYLKRYALPAHNLNIVESVHFTPEVEALVRGKTGVVPYGDIAYTLRAWPNHHRALNSMAKYHLRLKRKRQRIPIAAECWFQRAINFSPNDAITYMLYAMYLQKSKRYKKADEYYSFALKLKPNDIQIHYNYGLLLTDRKQFKKAKEHAKIAYDNAYPLPGLKKKLEAAGYWP